MFCGRKDNRQFTRETNPVLLLFKKDASPYGSRTVVLAQPVRIGNDIRASRDLSAAGSKEGAARKKVFLPRSRRAEAGHSAG